MMVFAQTEAFSTEQCTSPSIYLYRFEVLRGGSNHSPKNYGFLCDAIFSSLVCMRTSHLAINLHFSPSQVQCEGWWLTVHRIHYRVRRTPGICSVTGPIPLCHGPTAKRTWREQTWSLHLEHLCWHLCPCRWHTHYHKQSLLTKPTSTYGTELCQSECTDVKSSQVWSFDHLFHQTSLAITCLHPRCPTTLSTGLCEMLWLLVVMGPQPPKELMRPSGKPEEPISFPMEVWEPFKESWTQFPVKPSTRPVLSPSWMLELDFNRLSVGLPGSLPGGNSKSSETQQVPLYPVH